MDRIRVSLGPYGYWLKSRDEDDLETVPASGLIQRSPSFNSREAALPSGKRSEARRSALPPVRR